MKTLSLIIICTMLLAGSVLYAGPVTDTAKYESLRKYRFMKDMGYKGPPPNPNLHREPETYKINAMSETNHQLDVVIRFNAIPNKMIIQIMDRLNGFYGETGTSQRACRLEFEIGEVQ